MSSERPASGSRWEPADPAAEPTDAATPAEPGDTATATLDPDAPHPDADHAEAEPAAEPPAWGVPAYAAAGPGAGAPLWTTPPESPTPRGRRLLLAGAAVLLLGIGGAGGYWIGHATAPAAAAGTHLRHGFGSGRGQFGQFGGDGGFGGGFGGAGSGANGTTGGTGTGTGTST